MSSAFRTGARSSAVNGVSFRQSLRTLLASTWKVVKTCHLTQTDWSSEKTSALPPAYEERTAVNNRHNMPTCSSIYWSIDWLIDWRAYYNYSHSFFYKLIHFLSLSIHWLIGQLFPQLLIDWSILCLNWRPYQCNAKKVEFKRRYDGLVDGFRQRLLQRCLEPNASDCSRARVTRLTDDEAAFSC